MKSTKEKNNALLESIRSSIRSIFAKFQSAKVPLVRLTKEKDLTHTKFAQEQPLRKKRRRNSSKYNPESNPGKNLTPNTTQPQNTKFSLSQLKSPVKISSIFKRGNNRKLITAAAAAVALALMAGGLVAANTEKNAWAVLVNGSQVALVEDRQGAEQALAALKAEKAKIWHRSVEIKDTVSFRDTKVKLYKIDNIAEMTRILDKKIEFVAAVTGIKIDGKIGLLVEDEQTAKDVLKSLKESYAQEGIRADSVRFQEKVEIVQVPGDLKEISEPDKAIEILKTGRKKKLTHIVSTDDSLWSIARKYDMHVSDLRAANPDLKGDLLSDGQELNLVRLEPLVNVLAEGQLTKSEEVPYKVVVEQDGSVWRGKQKVRQEGENGAREVTYKVVFKNGVEVDKKVLNEKVLKPAKDEIVVKGSRFVVASRRGGSTLGWPVSGGINSEYGRRWGRMHTGIDIDGSTGEPVGAAADGEVISAGWDGGYGKAVVIRHGNGLVTKYAHLSEIEVEVGQQVSRGDLIGKVGSTGHSTGSHLHFEVIVDGSFQNPMRFLR